MNYKDAKAIIKESLKNFGTKYIDLFLIHWPGVQQIEDRIGVWKALEEGVEEGIIKSIGVSNFKVIHLQSILKVCKIKPVINQIELHPLYIDKETIDFCKKRRYINRGIFPIC